MGTSLNIGGSSNIDSASYDGAAGVLTIVFINGGVYEYDDVSTEEASEFASASSPGGHFHAHIKNNKSCRRIS